MCISIEPFYLNNSIIGWLMTGKKEKLSEVEQQLKRAEAAQRRRMQSEKAAREAEVCSIISCLICLLASKLPHFLCVLG
jgi:hypothetical protein